MNRKVGVILSYVLMVFEVMSTLLLTPFIIRTLGQAEYGVYKLSVSINAYLLLLDLGISNSTIRYIAKYRANGDKLNERKFMGVVTIYYLIMALIALIIGSFLVGSFPKVFAKGLTAGEIALGQKLLGITMITSAITLATSAYSSTILAYERFYLSKGLAIFTILMKMLFTFIALKGGMGSIGIVMVNLFLTILGRGAYVFFVIVKLKLKPLFKGINRDFLKEVFTYSSLILIQMIATQINASADQVLLGSLVAGSATIIAVYGVGTQVVQYFQTIGNAFSGVLFPGIVRLVEGKSSPPEICNEMVRIGRITFSVLGIIWAVFLLFGNQFIVLWAGSENSSAYYVTSILISAYLIIITEAVGTQVLWAKGKHKEQTFLKFGIVVLNVILTVVLIKWNPLFGATIGTFISLILGDIVVMNFVFKKKIGISLKQYYKGLFKGILPCLLATLVAGVLVRQLTLSGWMGFIINALIMVMVYGICMILFGFNKYEKNLMHSILKIRKGE